MQRRNAIVFGYWDAGHVTEVKGTFIGWPINPPQIPPVHGKKGEGSDMCTGHDVVMQLLYCVKLLGNAWDISEIL